VVPDDELADRARAVAVELAAGPTLAYAALRAVTAFSATHSLDESLELEGEWMTRTGASADHAEAVDAFLAKRPAQFTGR
jgi:2-(1,2-epoxy-1,2-dihydrophenyl)acetyl-CoA isomerase